MNECMERQQKPGNWAQPPPPPFPPLPTSSIPKLAQAKVHGLSCTSNGERVLLQVRARRAPTHEHESALLPLSQRQQTPTRRHPPRRTNLSSKLWTRPRSHRCTLRRGQLPSLRTARAGNTTATASAHSSPPSAQIPHGGEPVSRHPDSCNSTPPPGPISDTRDSDGPSSYTTETN